MIENQNAAIWFVDRHLNENRGEKIAFREADGEQRELTYRQLAEKSAQLGGALKQFDVRQEERIALIMLDQIEFPIVFWGAIKSGVIPVPINTMLTAEIYESILRDSRSTMLFVSSVLWESVKNIVPNCPDLRKIVVVGEDLGEHENFSDFIDKGKPIDVVSASYDSEAFWLYSSGSTGLPKGVRHLHSNLKATSDLYGQGVVGIGENDIVYSVAKLFFAYGLGNGLTFPLAVGATSILFGGRPTPDGVIGVLNNFQPTIFYCVPTLYAALNVALETVSDTLQVKLRRCISAGEALPREVGERWEELIGTEILDGVGSTELLHIFLSNRPGEVVYGSSGFPVPGYEVRLVDEFDQEVADDEIGELLVNAPSAAEGYWKRRQKSLATFQGYWTRTGDKYTRDSKGRFVYCGRTDDMFKVSGNWVSPFEVEQAISAHDAVLEAAVVPWEDKHGLEKPKAYVVLKEGHQESELADLPDFVKQKIGAWKYPRWVETVTELPKTSTGKIQRFKLRQESN